MNEVRAAYERSGEAWRQAPEQAYRRLAEAMLEGCGITWRGKAVLDVGTGTGAVAHAAARRGARVVGSDFALGMLHLAATPGVVADASALPFASGTFDAVLAGFVLGHLPDPARALGEARRVAPILVASAFASTWAHPAKAIVDEVLGEFGFEVPDWYRAMKHGEDRVSSPQALQALAADAGFDHAVVVEIEVATGIESPAAMVAWRTGMAHLAPFLAGLDPQQRQEARQRAERAVAGLPPVVVPMLVLSASGEPTG